MAKRNVSLITKGPYVSLWPHDSLISSLMISLTYLSDYFGIGVGYAGQWVGKAHNIETSRVHNRHQVWRNGQPLRFEIK